MKSVLITGGAGFIGSNFVEYFTRTHPNITVVNMDKLTYAANLKNLDDVVDAKNYTFVQADICDRSAVDHLFATYRFDSIFHLAAESHVDNSIEGPEVFVRTNVLGTFNLLDAARKLWMRAPFETQPEFSNARFLHISTDEVYGTLGDTGLFTETTPYAPNSPYSASKAGSDLLVRSYFHTYGLNTVTTNCSNNYGPKQHGEKLIPTILRKALSNEPIPIYGDGKNIRDWLYVADHCTGLELAFKKGAAGETYNIGGNNERRNIDIAKSICSHLDTIRPRTKGSYHDLITYVKDRPGHDRRYAIDATKIHSALNWKANETFDTGIIKTINWYLEKM